MPYFRVMLSGTGISCPVEDGSDPIIGFFTTRDVYAADIDAAELSAAEIVLAEWTSGGEYALANQGPIPSIDIEESYRISLFRGIFARKRSGYAFYCHE